MKRIVVIVAGIAAVGGAAWAVTGGQRAAAPAPAVTPPRELVAPAMVEPKGEIVELGFEITGRIAEVLVEEGDKVAEGQVLVRLDDRLARAQLAKAEAVLAAAQARLDEVRRGSRPDEVRAARAEAAAAAAQA